MANNSKDRRYRKAKKLLRYALRTLNCYFCDEGLLARDFKWTKMNVTVHHVDHVHENDVPSNTVFVHTSCHKSYHRRDENLKRAERKKAGIV